MHKYNIDKRSCVGEIELTLLYITRDMHIIRNIIRRVQSKNNLKNITKKIRNNKTRI
jgi:hypothetical protein